MNKKGRFLKVMAAAVAVFWLAGNVQASEPNETKTYNSNDIYTCSTSIVEIYALGGGGGGEGGNYYKCTKKTGTGSAGGGGGAIYAKLRVNKGTRISMTVGGVSNGGQSRYADWCGNIYNGYDGEPGKETQVTVDSKTLKALGGGGGGRSASTTSFSGGGAGGWGEFSAAAGSIKYLDSASSGGGGGYNGNGTTKITTKGGQAAKIDRGSLGSFGGHLGGESMGATWGDSGGTGAGGAAGYDAFQDGHGSGGRGGAGQVVLVITRLWTVTFNSNGGTAVSSKTDVLNGDATTAPTPPTRTGYTFDGWYKEQTFVNKWDFSNSKVTANTTLYARWTPIKYGIIYNRDGGVDIKDKPNKTEYTIETLPVALQDQERTHWVFDGWYNKSGSKITSITSIPANGKDTTLDAKWKQIKYTVTFNTLGGSPIPASEEVISGLKVSRPSVNPTKEGTVFFGWFKEAACINPWIFANDIVESNITLYASYGANRLGLSDESFIYNGKPQKLGTIKLLKSEGSWVDLVEGTHFDVVYKNNTNSGEASATITCKGDYAYINVQEIFFTIRKREISVSWYNTTLDWNGELQSPTPISSDNSFPVAVTPQTQKADAGYYTAEALPLDTNVLITMNQKVSYKINPKYVPIKWENLVFTYNGTEQTPTASTVGEDFELTVEPDFESVTAGVKTARAVLKDANSNIVLTNDKTSYQILKKEMSVEWKNTGPFEYNKMVQAPTAKINTGDEKFDTLALSVSNSHSQVGKYSGQQAAIASIIDQRIAGNVILTSNICDYEITRRPLDVVLKDREGNPAPKVKVAKIDRVTVGAVFDSLKALIGYDGFAVDTLKNETDNAANSLSGAPKFEISRMETGSRSRSLTRDGTLKIGDLIENGEYNVTIKVSDITAQNYSLNDGKAVLKVSDLLLTFSNTRDDDDDASNGDDDASNGDDNASNGDDNASNGDDNASNGDDNASNGDDNVPIRDRKKSDKKHGILLEKAVVSHPVKISVKTPEQAQINLAIYDNAGNVVYKTSGKNTDTFVWNLTNNAGRNVANGTYLIVVEARGAKGNYAYSAKVGVKK